MSDPATTPDIQIDTKTALYRKRLEDEMANSLDLANQVDQLRAANAQLVQQYNALVEETRRLSGEAAEGIDPAKLDAGEVTVKAKRRAGKTIDGTSEPKLN